MMQNEQALSILVGLQFKKVAIVMTYMGQQMTLKGTVVRYSKPFIEMRIGKVNRIFNENIIREIVPEQQGD